MRRKLVDVTGRVFSIPADEERNADSALVHGPLESLLARIEERIPLGEVLTGSSPPATSHTIVRHEDDDGVFVEVPFFQHGVESPHILVDVLNHAVEASLPRPEAEVRKALGVGGWSDKWAVWSVGGNVGEERGLLVLHGFDPSEGSGEEDVGAVTLGLHERSIMANHGIKILVTRGIRTGTVVGLPDTSGTVDEGLVKAALMGLIRVFVPEVPLSENSGSVAGALEDLRQDGGLQRHALALEDGMRDPVLQGVAASHDCGPGRGAGRTDKEASEPRALVVKSIEVGGLDPRVSVAANWAVSLVIGNDQNDIGRLGDGRGRETAQEAEEGEKAFHRIQVTSRCGRTSSPRRKSLPLP